MSNEIITKFAIGQVPDLAQTIPSGRNDQRHRLRRRETYTRNPLSVSFRVATDGVLAFSKSVPKADSSISGSCVATDIVMRNHHKENNISWVSCNNKRTIPFFISTTATYRKQFDDCPPKRRPKEHPFRVQQIDVSSFRWQYPTDATRNPN